MGEGAKRRRVARGVKAALKGAAKAAVKQAPKRVVEGGAMNVAKRRGAKRAKVALARKLGVVLHRMWVDETDFRFGQPAQA